MFKPGDVVILVRGISKMETELLTNGNTNFTVKRIDVTNGYVVVENEWGAWHVHPESLEPSEEF